jgi:hypothetical protein
LKQLRIKKENEALDKAHEGKNPLSTERTSVKTSSAAYKSLNGDSFI